MRASSSVICASSRRLRGADNASAISFGIDVESLAVARFCWSAMVMLARPQLSASSMTDVDDTAVHRDKARKRHGRRSADQDRPGARLGRRTSPGGRP